jgi:protein TonB
MVPINFGLSNPAAENAGNAPSKASTQAQGYDEIPVFTGGETAMFKFINSKLIYPKTAKEKNISGKVGVRFTINIDGTIGEVIVSKGVSPELDAEAIRVVKLLPTWQPAKLGGTPVKVWYSIPVIFTLK